MSRYYRDDQGRVMRVTDGWTSGRSWFVAYQVESGALRRYRSPYTPTRTTRVEAQADLDALAAEREWEVVE